MVGQSKTDIRLHFRSENLTDLPSQLDFLVTTEHILQLQWSIKLFFIPGLLNILENLLISLLGITKIKSNARSTVQKHLISGFRHDFLVSVETFGI